MIKKNILMLARRDTQEAMRVTAGLAVRGHNLTFYFLKSPSKDANGRYPNLEMLEVMEIKPHTVLSNLEEIATFQTEEELATAIANADHVISI